MKRFRVAVAIIALMLPMIGWSAGTASASTDGCQGAAASKDYSGVVCGWIDGVGVHTDDIGGSWEGNYMCTTLKLYINGRLTQTKSFCAARYSYNFPIGTNHYWPTGTSVNVCAYVAYLGTLCMGNRTIHW